jgi:hypothetical protein
MRRRSEGRRSSPLIRASLLAEERELSAEELLELTSSISSAVRDTQAIRDKIFEEFDAAVTNDQRTSLLGMFKATMDIAESHLEKSGDVQRLAQFREARADDCARLLVRESSVGEDLSPEMCMAVTDREIAAGRLTPADPIRQVAVKAAAAPDPSHAELLARAKAREASDMSIETLINELRTAKSLDIVEVRKRIQEEFDAATTSHQRSRLLAIFNATMDQVERSLASRGEQEELLENLKTARAQDYKIFIVQECTVGLDSPGGGDVSVEMLMAVTNREIAAGRMTEDHSLRKIAVEGAAAPHMSHAELVATHARLKAEAAQLSPPVSDATGSKANAGYRFGAVLGRKLKALFRK